MKTFMDQRKKIIFVVAAEDPEKAPQINTDALPVKVVVYTTQKDMPKKCSLDGCRNFVFSKGYCKNHQQYRTDYKRPVIKQYSDKREAINQEYYALREPFLKENPKCQIKSPECTTEATVVHHSKGRLGNLLKVSTWFASCKRCNNFLEGHVKWALDNGFIYSRHAKEQ